MSRAVLPIACLFLLATSMAFADDTLWTVRKNGSANRDADACIVLVDQTDCVISVGSVVNTGTGYDISVTKYGPDGNQLWTTTVGEPGNVGDRAVDAALDASGNVYVTGRTGTYPDYNILIAKINTLGPPVAWIRTYEGSAGKADEPAAIAVDAAGNPIVAGYTTGAGSIADWVIFKLMTVSGLPMWTVVNDGGGDDHPAAIAIGPQNSVYVTGYRQYPTSHEDFLTGKYSTTGVEQWYQSWNGPGNANDRAVAIAVDTAGSAYVTGKSSTDTSTTGHFQFATVKYASDTGAKVWDARYDGTGRGNMPVAIALGASAVYVTGSSQNSAGNDDYATVAYGVSGGNQLWVTRYDGPAGKNDDPADIAVLPYGMILVTGTSIDAADKGDYLTLRYRDDGAEDWVSWYNSPFDNDDQGKSLAFDSHSNPLVLGNSYGDGKYDMVTVKYDSSAAGGINESKTVGPRRSEMRLAPNPARNWTNVQHSLSGAVSATISLLGVDGRVVRTQRFDGQAGGPARLDLAGLTPGVYVARLVSGARALTQKLVIEQ